MLKTCLRYDKKLAKGAPMDEYVSTLSKVATFSTVEGFWRTYIHLKRPSSGMENNLNLYLFRDGPGHVPAWESYPNGGCWFLKVRKHGQGNPAVMGKLWQDLVLATVGEVFETPAVVGIGIATRQQNDLLSVWNDENGD
ncbi:unnamed protein product, partial [Phaeothamnion confervicola]